MKIFQLCLYVIILQKVFITCHSYQDAIIPTFNFLIIFSVLPFYPYTKNSGDQGE